MAAVFAVAAFTASSALAGGPEWGKCESVGAGSGKYSANCTTKEKGGGYEWKKGKSLAPVPFTGHNVGSGGNLFTASRICQGGKDEEKRVSAKTCEAEGGKVYLEEGEYLEVECKTETNSGVAEGKNLVSNVHVTFTGCDIFGGLPCNSAGAAPGEIQTTTLKGALGYINKAAHEVGIMLTPAEKNGVFAKFLCSGILETGVGIGNKKEGFAHEPKGGQDQIIAPITPVNQMTSEYTQTYTVNLTNVQNIPSSFEGKKPSLLEDYFENVEEHKGSMWSAAGEEVTNVNTPSEPGEIKG